MKTRHWLGLGLLLLFLIGGAYLLLNALVGSYLSAHQMTDRLEKISGRNARVDSVRFSLWSGIQVDKVELSAHPDWDRGIFLEARRITLHPDIWALLGGDFVVSSARVSGVEMRVNRGTNGHWNITRGFDDTSGDSPHGGEIPFAIRNLTFTDGEIRFRDEVVQQTVPLSFHRIRLMDYRPGKGGTLHFDNLILPRGNLIGRVRFQLRKPSLEVLDLRMNYVGLETFRPYVKRLLPPPLGSAAGTLNARFEQISVDSRAIRGVGQLTLNNTRIPGDTSVLSSVDRLSLSGEAALEIPAAQLHLDVRDLRVNDRLLVRAAVGELSPPWDNPALEGQLDLGDVRLESLIQWAGWFGYRPLPENWELAGQLETSELSVSGSLFDPGFGGTATFSRLVVRGPGMPAELPLESLRLDLTGDELEVRSGQLTAGGGSFSLRGRIRTAVPLTESRVDLTLGATDVDASILRRGLGEWNLAELPRVRMSGDIDELSLSLVGPIRNLSWTGSGQFGGVDLSLPLIPGELTDLEGGWSADASGLRLDRVRGKYDQHPFSVGGWIPWGDDPERPLSVRGELLHFPAERLRERLIPGMWPEGLVLRGPTSFREWSLEGPLDRLRWEGVVEPERIRVEHERLDEPLKQVQGSVHVEGRRPPAPPTGTPDTPVEAGYRLGFRGSVEGSYRGNPFAVEGTVPYPVKSGDSFALGGHVQQLPSGLLLPLFERLNTGEELTLSGPLTVNDVRVSGTPEEVGVTGDFELNGIDLSSSILPHPLEGVTGRVRVRLPPDGARDTSPRTRDVRMDLKARYRQRPVQVEGSLTHPLTPEGTYDLSLSAKRFPLETLLRVLPGPTLAGANPSGSVTSRDLRIRGPASDPRLEGTVMAEDVEVQPPFMSVPIEGLTGEVLFRGNELRIKRLRGELLNRPLDVEGTIEKEGEVWKPSLTVRTEDLPVLPFVNGLRGAPSLPPEWSPGGTVSSDLRWEGTLQQPRLNGVLRASQLDLGVFGAGDARGQFTYDSDLFRLHSLRVPLFGGEYRGTLSSGEGGEVDRIRLDGRVQSLKLGSLLPALAGVGQGSSGRLNGTLEGSTPIARPREFTGSLGLEGKKLVFRNVEALERLSLLLNTNLTRVIETGLARALLNLFTLDLKGSKKRIQSLFGTKVTTRFDRAKATITFEHGKGTVRRLHLSNSEIEMDGRGSVWLDGRLDLRVEITPRRNLLNRIEETFLRSLITGGFPTLRIQGTVQQPRFDERELRRGLQSQLLSVVTGMSR